jgi:hypothetical protein
MRLVPGRSKVASLGIGAVFVTIALAACAQRCDNTGPAIRDSGRSCPAGPEWHTGRPARPRVVAKAHSFDARVVTMRLARGPVGSPSSGTSLGAGEPTVARSSASTARSRARRTRSRAASLSRLSRTQRATSHASCAWLASSRAMRRIAPRIRASLNQTAVLSHTVPLVTDRAS